MPGIYLIGIVFMLLSFAVSWQLKRKFREFSQTRLASGLSGREVAERMLADHGIRDVQVISVEGELTDHYDPSKKTVNLSQFVYSERSAAAAAVAAHECGHAVQHAKAYTFLKFRSAMVPALSVASRYMQWILLIGILMIQTTKLPLAIGVGLFALTTLFSFITLPVEFDASNRALKWIEQRQVVTKAEYGQARSALWWAATTYVVAALGSLATLLYYVSLLMGGGRRDS